VPVAGKDHAASKMIQKRRPVGGAAFSGSDDLNPLEAVRDHPVMKVFAVPGKV
jgi:hypothetical protein